MGVNHPGGQARVRRLQLLFTAAFHGRARVGMFNLKDHSVWKVECEPSKGGRRVERIVV